MELIVVLVGGVIGGFLIPRRPKALAAGLFLALLYTGVVIGYAMSLSYTFKGALALMLLITSPDVMHPGLSGLIAAGDIWVVGVVVCALRFLFTRRSSNTS